MWTLKLRDNTLVYISCLAPSNLNLDGALFFQNLNPKTKSQKDFPDKLIIIVGKFWSRSEKTRKIIYALVMTAVGVVTLLVYKVYGPFIEIVFLNALKDSPIFNFLFDVICVVLKQVNQITGQVLQLRDQVMANYETIFHITIPLIFLLFSIRKAFIVSICLTLFRFWKDTNSFLE